MHQTEVVKPIDIRGNYNNKTKFTCFIQPGDLNDAIITSNTYLAAERMYNTTVNKNANDIIIMQDLFGALDY